MHRDGPARAVQSLLGSTTAPLTGKVALRPIRPADLPIAQWVARDFLEDALAALLRASADRNGARLSVIVRTDLRERVNALWESTHDQDSFDRSLERLLADAAADLELVGAFRCRNGALAVRLRVVTAGTPRLLAQSGWVQVADNCDQTDARATTLDGALDAAARHFADRAGHARTVHFASLTHAATGVHTDFGGRVAEALIARYEHHLNRYTGMEGAQLRARRVNFNDLAWRRVVAGQEPVSALTGSARDAFVLNGSYWPLSATEVEIRVWLRGLDGDIPWTGIARGVPLGRFPMTVLAQPLQDLAGDFPGHFGLRLISQQGDDPEYPVGADFRFGVRLARSAYVQCFSADEHDTVARILPNAHLPTAYLRGGGGMLTLPDDLRPPDLPVGAKLRWPVHGPPGVMVVKCFASARPMTPRLPAPFRDPVANLLPGVTATRLLETFRHRFGGEEFDEASLTVTITP